MQLEYLTPKSYWFPHILTPPPQLKNTEFLKKKKKINFMKNPKMFEFQGKGTLRVTAQRDLFLPVRA